VLGEIKVEKVRAKMQNVRATGSGRRRARIHICECGFEMRGGVKEAGGVHFGWV